MKRERWILHQYLPIECGLCGAVGTIVELGACCRVRELDLDWLLRDTRAARIFARTQKRPDLPWPARA
jgi:hypothetical protein